MNAKSTNPIRERNKNLLLQELKKVRTATKPQLASLTGISLVTVNALIKDLAESGEVTEDMAVQPQLGRPAASYKYNAAYKLALIIFMHESNKKDEAYFTVCNLYGESIFTVSKPLESVKLDSFDQTIEELLSEYPAIRIIGFGIPGQESGSRLIISDYDGLRDAELRPYMEDRFKLPVFVENDINAAIAGYCRLESFGNGKCAAGLYFPGKYAPGAGICRNGELIKGRDGLAGEIKYLPFGIDWEDSEYDEEAVNGHIVKVIQVFMCLYNPDRIVLYKEGAEFDFQRALEQECLSDIEKMMMPEIVISDRLNADFKTGMIHLALEKMEKNRSEF